MGRPGGNAPASNWGRPLSFRQISRWTSKDHLVLMQLHSQEITQLHCDANGTLALEFHGGQSLTVSGNPSDDSNPEPWVVTRTNAKTTEGGAKVVSLGSSGFVVWARTLDLPDVHKKTAQLMAAPVSYWKRVMSGYGLTLNNDHTKKGEGTASQNNLIDCPLAR